MIEDNYVIVYSADDIQTVNEKINQDYKVVDFMDEDIMDKFLEQQQDNFYEDSVILFNLGTFFKKNLISYNYNTQDIWKQFDVDCPRMKIYVNNKRIKNQKNFKNKLKSLLGACVIINTDIFEIIDILGMLCNQSSFFLSYKFLHKAKQFTYDNDYIQVTNSSSNRSVKVNIKHNKLSIIAETNFAIKNILEDKIISKINTVIVIDGCVKNNYASFAKNGMLISKII